jgi:hypothetical protein
VTPIFLAELSILEFVTHLCDFGLAFFLMGDHIFTDLELDIGFVLIEFQNCSL